MEEEKNEPIKRIPVGRLEAAIWENRNEVSVWHTVTYSRRYRDGEESKHTTSFRFEDLPVIERLSHEAFHWILERQKSLREGSETKRPARKAPAPHHGRSHEKNE